MFRNSNSIPKSETRRDMRFIPANPVLYLPSSSLMESHRSLYLSTFSLKPKLMNTKTPSMKFPTSISFTLLNLIYNRI